jgi:hypothetical protein
LRNLLRFVEEGVISEELAEEQRRALLLLHRMVFMDILDLPPSMMEALASVVLATLNSPSGFYGAAPSSSKKDSSAEPSSSGASASLQSNGVAASAIVTPRSTSSRISGCGSTSTAVLPAVSEVVPSSGIAGAKRSSTSSDFYNTVLGKFQESSSNNNNPAKRRRSRSTDSPQIGLPLSLLE